MTSRKAEYVRAEAAKPHDGSHLCHAVACERPVPPAILMCAEHWRMVPGELQREVWRTYRPGQERDKHPSAAYVQAQKRAIEAVAALEQTAEGTRHTLAEPPLAAPSAPPDRVCEVCHRSPGIRLVVETKSRHVVLCVRCWHAWVSGEIEVGS